MWDSQHWNSEISIARTDPTSAVVAFLTFIGILRGVCSIACHLKSAMGYIAYWFTTQPLKLGLDSNLILSIH